MKKVFNIALAGVILLLFSACSNLIDDSFTQTANNDSSVSQKSSEDGKSYLTVQLADDSSRTALPLIVQKDEFNYLVLKARKAGEEDFEVLSSWTSDESLPASGETAYSKMTASSIPITAGDWELTLRASKNGVTAYESGIVKVSVANGVIKLISFNLMRSDILMMGKGSIKITLNYDNDEEGQSIKQLYALCEQVSGNESYSTTMTKLNYPAEDGKYIFTAGSSSSKIPAGVYCVTYFFYSDEVERTITSGNHWTNCIGYWREYAIVAGEMESVSEKTIESVGSLYHIKLLDGESSVSPQSVYGTTIPETFTRFSDEILLPVSKGTYDSIKERIEEAVKLEYTDESERASVVKERMKPYTYVEKDGYVFDGWYDNEAFSGDRITIVPAGASKDYKLYSKWNKLINITYHYKNATGSSDTKTVSPIEGYSFNLYDTSDMEELGITYAGKIFLGWTTNPENPFPDNGFEAGAECIALNDLDLYEIWADIPYTTIPVVVSSVTDEAQRAKYQAEFLRLAKEKNAYLSKNYGEWKQYVDTTDSDKDGLYDWEEAFVTITSPWNRDTDGDGWDDKTELPMFNKTSNTFNPLISDLPKLKVTITSAPYFTYTYTSTNGKTLTDSVTRTETGSFGHTTNSTNSNAYTSSYEGSLSFTTGYNWAAATPGWMWSITGGFKKNWSFTDTYSFSKGESETYSKAVANGKVNTASESRTITGGNVKIAVKFSNPSELAYTVNNVVVEAFRKQSGVLSSKPFYLPLGSMKSGSSVSMTMQPHSESGIINYELSLTPQQFEDLMRNTSAFDVGVAGYSISMKDSQKRGSDFTDEYTNSYQLTTLVNIDYGPSYNRNTESYNVAAKFKPKLESSGTGINTYEDLTLDDILKICVGEGNYVIKDSKLISIYGLKNSSSKKEGSWYVDYRYYDAQEGKDCQKVCGPDSPSDKDLDNIIVGAKTMFSIFYDIDADEDGVPLRIEKEFGSSDQSLDSDRDGISDYKEIFGWKPSEEIKSTKYRTKTGTHSKLLEESVRTRPNSNDTDGDGWTDGEDPNPVVPRDLTDSSLKSITYSFGASQKSKVIEKIPQAKDGKANLEMIKADGFTKIWLAPLPTLVTSTVKYAVAEGLKNSEPDIPAADSFATIPASGIPLMRNYTYIFIKVLAPDRETSTVYTLKVSSPYKDITSPSESAVPKDAYLNLDIAFDSYIDDRTNIPQINYIFAASTSKVPDTLSDTDIAKAIPLDSAKPGRDFLLKLEPSHMKAGRFSVPGMLQKNDYKAAIYAWSKNDSGFYCKRIYYKDKVSFGLAKKGKVKVYLNWMRLAWDPNAFGKPEYFWTIQMTNKNGELLQNGKLSEVKASSSMSLNMDRYNWVNFSDDQCGYGKQFKSDCTPKTFVYEFDQFDDQEIHMQKSIYYETAKGADEPLTRKDFVIKYDKSAQKWTVTGDSNYYSSPTSKYVPGTNPTTTKAAEYQYGTYETSVSVEKPGQKKDFENYYSRCSSNGALRWEYGGLILNISIEWMD